MKRHAIIVAGGQGQRMGADIPKQFLKIDGRPIVFFTIEKFLGVVDEIILVLPETQMSYWKELCESLNFFPNIKVVKGGTSRTESVKNGLELLDETGVVAIHDAVRPFASQNLIELLFEETLNYGNAIPVLPVRETLRYVDAGINQIADRNKFVSVQTPQVFNNQNIISAYKNAAHSTFTDDASVIEQDGGTIHLVKGESTNIKITFPEDLIYAEAMYKKGLL